MGWRAQALHAAGARSVFKPLVLPGENHESKVFLAFSLFLTCRALEIAGLSVTY